MGEAREAQGEERRLNDIYVPSVYLFAETREARPEHAYNYKYNPRAFWSSRTDVYCICMSTVYPVRPLVSFSYV